MVGTIAAVLQPISGDMAARLVAVTQPVKLAAMESQFQTEQGAPLRIGGIPDTQHQQVYFALEIPNGLSLLAFHDPNAVIVGLDSVPQQDWPVVPVVHIGFQVMVGSGMALLLFGLWYWFLRWRKREPGTWLLRFVVLGGVLGVMALEAGWSVSEVGGQPGACVHGAGAWGGRHVGRSPGAGGGAAIDQGPLIAQSTVSAGLRQKEKGGVTRLD